jgi:OOP family OmpA-OmpF porin
MQRDDVFTSALATILFSGAMMVVPNGAHAALPAFANGFYVGAGAGQARQDNTCGAPGAVLTSCDTQDISWKAYLGYQVNNWLSAEVGYVDFGSAEFNSGNTDTHGITAHAVGMIPIPLDNQYLNKISILGKIGTVRWDRSRDSVFGTNGDRGFAFAWGTGLQYTFNEHIGVRGEWERFEGVGNSTVGKGDVDMWTVGLNYKF